MYFKLFLLEKKINKFNKQNSIVLSEENVRQFEKLVSLLFLSINVVKYLKVKRKTKFKIWQIFYQTLFFIQVRSKKWLTIFLFHLFWQWDKKSLMTKVRIWNKSFLTENISLYLWWSDTCLFYFCFINSISHFTDTTNMASFV